MTHIGDLVRPRIARFEVSFDVYSRPVASSSGEAGCLRTGARTFARAGDNDDRAPRRDESPARYAIDAPRDTLQGDRLTREWGRRRAGTRGGGGDVGGETDPRGDLKGQMHLIFSSGYDGLSACRRDADQDKDANRYDDEFLAVLVVMG